MVLLGDDALQGVGHPLELLLVCVVELVHALGECSVDDVIALCIPGGSLMYHGDNFAEEAQLFVL